MRPLEPADAMTTAALPDGGTRWRLPVRRRLGRLGRTAAFLVFFGLLFGGVPIGMFVAASNAFSWWVLLASPIALPFVFIGFMCVLMGVASLYGRADLEVRNGRLIAIDRLGPLRLRRSRPVERIAGFELKGGAIRTNGKALEARAGGEFSTLRATIEGGAKPWPLVGMYPRDMLLALARDLAQACDAAAPAELFDDGPPPVVEVDWRTEKAQPERAPVERPADTPITIEEAEGVTTIRVPPAGVQGARGMIAFGVLWEAFSLLACAAALWKWITNPASLASQGSPWVLAVVLPLFPLVGAGMLLYGFSLARRTTVLDIVGDTLLVTRSGLRKVRSWEWRAGDLERVRVGPSGTEINDEPVLALLIEARGGKKTVLLSEREAPELEWIAWEVTKALGKADANAAAA
ncbi:MAG: hypothetical protein ACF8QF_08700 [Phycisphaerales bacterium]